MVLGGFEGDSRVMRQAWGEIILFYQGSNAK